ncbi:MAG TPA: FmdB family zinc ribbon protein [Acidobacteriaceae bacterium]|nr:FmdB family zinc ribbon protein [Acidobacteriaceae bacterium]
MPLYEYQCQQCQQRVEKIQKFSDAPLATCPHCGGPLERTLTAAAVQFKGSGWYKDLYSSAKAPAASGDSAAKAPAGAEASGGTTAEKSPTTPAPAAAAPAAPAPSGSAGS